MLVKQRSQDTEPAEAASCLYLSAQRGFYCNSASSATNDFSCWTVFTARPQERCQDKLGTTLGSHVHMTVSRHSIPQEKLGKSTFILKANSDQLLADPLRIKSFKENIDIIFAEATRSKRCKISLKTKQRQKSRCRAALPAGTPSPPQPQHSHSPALRAPPHFSCLPIALQPASTPTPSRLW